MCDTKAIQVKNLSKCYRIYTHPIDRLKQLICPNFFNKSKKKDPYFTEHWALRDVSFEVKKGETLGIIGANGAGKSTLLQILCGILSPTSGHIEINGKIAALLELGTGFNAEFTGKENVFLYGSVLGLTKQEMEERFNAIADFADIGNFIDHPVKTYSSGMVVRLAFAVIAHANADILIIDEALAVGDAFFVQKCMRFLRDFMRRGTLIFVSHDTGAVINLCDHAILLQHGLIKHSGSAKEVAEMYLENILYAHKNIATDVQHDNSKKETSSNTETTAYRDMRLDYINSTPYRNDIELFKFDPDAESFGEGSVRIVSVTLVDEKRQPLSWVIGGELISILITGKAIKTINNPIVGFCIKDKLGQYLFGDNTYITHCTKQPMRVLPGKSIEALFTFYMPRLQTGDYSINVAVAEGTQENHIQQHWIHDALIFR
ncbi:ABC transporter ATP-binding protein, partial [Candidatus Pacearchaeota archaeon]|nr:ABC transporter ATP-binding protein [Candidatus Pacearchaeota archaeon]